MCNQWLHTFTAPLDNSSLFEITILSSAPKKQKKHFGARGMPTLDDEAYDDTVFLKVSEDATKTDYNTGEIGLQKDYSSFDQPKTDYQKAVQKCERINKLKMCSLLDL